MTRKKLLLFLLAMMMVFAFSACTDPEPLMVDEEETSPSEMAEEIAELFNELNPEVPFTATVPKDAELVVHYIDVGQGDSIFVQLPNKQTLLIDAGPGSAGTTVPDYLESLNVTTIDYLVATHPHEDHIGGMAAIIDAFTINAMYMPKVAHNTSTFERMLEAIQNKDMTITAAKAGVSILESKDLNIEILAPTQDDYKKLNDYSTIIRITYKDTGFIFSGDAEVTSESTITADIKSNVLMVGHHGSKTSTSQAYFDNVNPDIAVISCALVNDYGHPHKEIMARLTAADIPIYQTAQLGTIVITSDGTKITVANELEDNDADAATNGGVATTTAGIY